MGVSFFLYSASAITYSMTEWALGKKDWSYTGFFYFLSIFWIHMDKYSLIFIALTYLQYVIEIVGLKPK